MKTIKSNFVKDEDYTTSLLPKEKSSWAKARDTATRKYFGEYGKYNFQD